MEPKKDVLPMSKLHWAGQGREAQLRDCSAKASSLGRSSVHLSFPIWIMGLNSAHLPPHLRKHELGNIGNSAL